MKISEDKKSICLSLNGTLSAHELTMLIAELAVVRANMLPEVPKTPLVKSDGSMSVQDDPRLVIVLSLNEKLANQVNQAPILGLLGNLHTLKRVDWYTSTSKAFPYVSEILVSQGHRIKSYPQI